LIVMASSMGESSTLVPSRTIVERLRWLASERGRDTALVVVREHQRQLLETVLDYAELDRRARAVAAVLERQFEAGERALILLENDEHYVVALFACFYSRLVAVPAFPPESSKQRHLARITAIARDSQARCVLTTSAVAGAFDASFEALALPRRIALDELARGDESGWSARPVLDGDVAFLQYTSGSTSEPKGVVVTHANVVANARAIRRKLSVVPSDVFVTWLPLFHDMGLVGSLLQPIDSGVKVVLMAPRFFVERPIRWLRAIARHRGTVSGGPDFAYRLCLEKLKPDTLEGLDLSSWRVAFCGAEPIRRETLEGFAALAASAGLARGALYPCYGLAEATLFVTGGEPGRGMTAGRFSAEGLSRGSALSSAEGPAVVGCGSAVAEHWVEVVDPEGGGALEAGRVGEIWVSGPSIARGYWQNPEATRRSFVERDGKTWLRTGDLGFVSEEQLHVTGRLKELIIVRGHNLYPQDVERALEGLDGLRPGRVAAFAAPGKTGEGVGIAVEVAGSVRQRVPATELARAIGVAVSELCGESPTVVLLLEVGALTKTSSGKLQRNACRQAWLDGTLRPYARFDQGHWNMDGRGVEDMSEGVADAVEERLLMLVRETLKLADDASLNPASHFFLMGGDSLSGLELALRIEQEWGVGVTLRRLFEVPKLGALAAEIRRLQAVEAVSPTESRVVPVVLGRSEGGLTLTHAEQRQWFLWHLEPRSTAYHINLSLRFSGELRIDALRAAFSDLVARHEALRSVFRPDLRGVPRRWVLDAPELDFSVVDVCEHTESTDDAAEQAIRQFHERPFDLGAGPLFRAMVVRRTGASYVALSMHHVVSDAASVQVLLDELALRYREAPLPALSFGYGEYTSSQRERFDARRPALLAFWREQLQGELPKLTLATDRQALEAVPARAVRRAFELERGLLEALRRRAAESSASLFTLLLAGFQLVLGRHTGSRDVRVGVPVAGRGTPRARGLVGLFVNTLVVRTVMPPDLTLREIVARVRDSLLAAREHEDLPFEELVAALNPERAPGTNPLFEVMFNHLREDCAALERLPGLRFEGYELGEQAAQFELAVDSLERPDGSLRTIFTHTARFEPGAIERLFRHYEAVLRQLAALPERRVCELELLGSDERAELESWEVGGRVTECEPIQRSIERRARERGEAPALLFGDSVLTRRELNLRANRLAHQLIARGIGPERRVGIALGRSVEMVVAILAVLKAGGAYVPLDIDYPSERLAYLIQDSGLALLLSETSVAPLQGAVERVDIDALELESQPTHDPEPQLHGENLAYVIYTSGSTGRPKGVANTHGALSRHLQTAIEFCNLTESDRMLAFASLSFDAFVEQLFAPLVAGATVVLRGPELWDAERFRQELLAHGISVVDLTTSYWQALIGDFVRAGTRDYGGLRRANVGGEALPPAALELWGAAGLGHVELVNCYGPTEATVTATVADCTPYCRGESAVSGHMPIGAPLRGRCAYVLDSALARVPSGVAGELYIGGELLARGYSNRAGLTSERFVADPFGEAGARLYRTGDRVRWSRDGQLEYLGRADQQLKIRGFRVELGEIEAALRALDEVQNAAVVARELSGELRAVAFVAARAGRALDVDSVLGRLSRVLPPYLLPASVTVLDELPLTAGGKVDRSRLPAPHLALDRSFAEPVGDTEHQVARIWAEELGLERVGRRANFFELGGHSLLLMRVHQRLRERLGWSVSMVDLFRYPTVEALAAFAERREGGSLALDAVESRARRQRESFLVRKRSEDTK